MARHVEPLEQVIDCLISAAKSTHVERLQSGKCTIQNGFVLNDLLTNYERVSDHCSNIAVSLIETSAGSFDTHEYLNRGQGGRQQGLYRPLPRLYKEVRAAVSA